MNGSRDYRTKWSKRQRKDKYHIISLIVESKKKNDTNELIYRIETDTQTLKTNLWLPKWKGGRRNKLGAGINTHTHTHARTTRYKTDSQQAPNV